MNKTDEFLLFRSSILVGEDRKQINCVVETVAMGKAKAGQRDVALKKHSCLSILNVFINHQKSIWLMLVVAIVE